MMAHPAMGGTTGVSLEQGLGLKDISRGRPRAVGPEMSVALRRIIIIYKVNPSPTGIRIRLARVRPLALVVSMFLCNQSYKSHGRDFLLWATILNFDAQTPLWVAGSQHELAQAQAPLFLRSKPNVSPFGSPVLNAEGFCPYLLPYCSSGLPKY